jgi:preprotein translocase subunit Sec61beta
VVKFKKARNKDGPRGPSSALGIMSFYDSRKSLIRLSPESVLAVSILFGLVILVLQFL